MRNENSYSWPQQSSSNQESDTNTCPNICCNTSAVQKQFINPALYKVTRVGSLLGAHA